MRDVTILADDLTGAADTAIAFALAGLPTYVSFGPGPLPPSARVVAVDTDSRALDAAAAARRNHAAARGALLEGTRALYKKIDSTLRGNVGAEVAACVRAAAEVSGRALAVVCPAFPGTGRTVRGGRVLVNGVPLEQTEVWRKSGTSGPTELVALLSQAGLQAAAAAPDSPVPAGVQAIVCDAESEQDLQRIAEAFAALPLAVVWVGSAGLAKHLPAALGLRPAPPSAGRVAAGGGPVLALVGSRSSVAREQARELSADAAVDSFALSPELLAAGDSSADWRRAASALERSLAAGRDAVLTIELGEAVDLRRAPLLATALGRFAAGHAGRLGGLIATGGDIARAALAALGAGGLFLEGEVEPGVPIGVTDTARPLRVVTKAGAFGTADTLRRCRSALRQGSR